MQLETEEYMTIERVKHEPYTKQKSKSYGYQKPEKKIDMLLDIQAMIAKGKGPGYER